MLTDGCTGWARPFPGPREARLPASALRHCGGGPRPGVSRDRRTVGSGPGPSDSDRHDRRAANSEVPTGPYTTVIGLYRGVRVAEPGPGLARPQRHTARRSVTVPSLSTVTPGYPCHTVGSDRRGSRIESESPIRVGYPRTYRFTPLVQESRPVRDRPAGSRPGTGSPGATCRGVPGHPVRRPGPCYGHLPYRPGS
eukprot:756506-Hanusia_phi.AAC.2